MELSEFISPKLTKLELTSTTKLDAIKELVDMLDVAGYLTDSDAFLKAVLEIGRAHV